MKQLKELSIVQLTTVYNAVSDTKIKKFKDKGTAVTRTVDELASQSVVFHHDGDREDITNVFDFGYLSPAKAPKARKIVRTKYRRPKAGTVCGSYWDMCDILDAELGRAPLIEELSERLPHAPINSLRTDYSHWCVTYGVTRKERQDARRSLQAAG